MNENDQIAILQSLLDHYRTKYYQTEYDFSVYQIQAKKAIGDLEAQIRSFSAQESAEEE